jgi:hypothetical protein
LRILLDHCVDRRLRRHLAGHEVRTTYEMGWASYKNGALLSAAESEFDVLLTVDQNLPYQQNLSGRRIAALILVAPSNRLEELVPLIPQAGLILASLRPGQVVRVEPSVGT